MNGRTGLRASVSSIEGEACCRTSGAAKVQAAPLVWLVVALEILTNFRRAVAPEMTETHDRAHPKCLATRATSSALALPSTGDDRRRASHVPVGSCSIELTDERGFARTVMTSGAGSGWGVVRRSVNLYWPKFKGTGGRLGEKLRVGRPV
jgi:hypothetical protein